MTCRAWSCGAVSSHTALHIDGQTMLPVCEMHSHNGQWWGVRAIEGAPVAIEVEQDCEQLFQAHEIECGDVVRFEWEGMRITGEVYSDPRTDDDHVLIEIVHALSAMYGQIITKEFRINRYDLVTCEVDIEDAV